MNYIDEFRILDLFCGAGGFSYGMHKNEHFKTMVALDFNEFAANTFKKNMSSTHVVVGDITKEEVRKEIIDKSKELKVNMIIGGPPCQGFSLKGKNLGLADERNFLFLEYLKIVDELQPEVFVIENVKNLLASANGWFKDEIVEHIQKMGYNVNYGVLNAKDFGVPQKRQRAIFICSKNKEINLPVGDLPMVTVKDAISDLAYLESGKGEFEQKYKYKAKTDYQKLMRKGSTMLYNHQATNHSEKTIEKLKMIKPECGKECLPEELKGNQIFETTWGRLKWNDVSPTIDTRFDTPSNGTNSHPELNRAITPREAARIQSFDDNFIFYGKKSYICKQIGNAVPPLLAKAIADKIWSYYDKSNNENEDILVKNEVEETNYSIYNSDSYKYIKELKAKGIVVNHIITDPPYNISKKNNFNTLKGNRKGVDFGEWDKDFDLTSWILPYSEILDKNGSMVIFCSYLYISYICDALKDANMEIKDVILWQKTNPMPRNTDRRYVQDLEFAIWAVKKGSKWIFNKPKDIPYLRSIFKEAVVHGKEKTGHPTQKSLKLMEEIIKIHTNEGDMILDPFAGSGSTLEACLKNNRKCIGIELEECNFEIIKNRLDKYK